MEEFLAQVGIDPAEAAAVVVSTTVMYAVFVLIVRQWGQRLRTSGSVFSLALVTLIGSIAARATLNDSPSMAAGLIALSTLFLLEWVSRNSGLLHAPARMLPGGGRGAVALVVDGVVQTDQLARLGVGEALLLARLRQAGVADRRDVALAVLEARGELTVVRTGKLLDRALFAGVDGIDRMPDSAFLPE